MFVSSYTSTASFKLDGDLRGAQDKKPIVEDPMAFQEYLAAPWKKPETNTSRILFNQLWCS